MKIRIIRIDIQQFMKRSVITNALCGSSINKMNGSKKSLVLVFQWHRCMSKQGEAHFNDMPMLSFGYTVLLVWGA
jgi:hypothetical protein